MSKLTFGKIPKVMVDILSEGGLIPYISKHGDFELYISREMSRAIASFDASLRMTCEGCNDSRITKRSEF